MRLKIISNYYGTYLYIWDNMYIYIRNSLRLKLRWIQIRVNTHYIILYISRFI